MNYNLFFVLFICTPSFLINAQTRINPSGTYELNKYLLEQDDGIYESYGEIQVKALEKDSVIISFFICMGEPGYNVGSFVDTLSYFNASAIYTTPYDSSCSLTFTYTDSSLHVKQESALTFGPCGFGYGVIIDNVYTKISNEIPIIRDLLTDEIIK